MFGCRQHLSEVECALSCVPSPGQTPESPMPEDDKGSRRRGGCSLLSWDLSATQSPSPPGYWVLPPCLTPPNHPFHPLPQLRKFWDMLLEPSSLQPSALVPPQGESQTQYQSDSSNDPQEGCISTAQALLFIF